LQRVVACAHDALRRISRKSISRVVLISDL